MKRRYEISANGLLGPRLTRISSADVLNEYGLNIDIEIISEEHGEYFDVFKVSVKSSSKTIKSFISLMNKKGYRVSLVY